MRIEHCRATLLFRPPFRLLRSRLRPFCLISPSRLLALLLQVSVSLDYFASLQPPSCTKGAGASSFRFRGDTRRMSTISWSVVRMRILRLATSFPFSSSLAPKGWAWGFTTFPPAVTSASVGSHCAKPSCHWISFPEPSPLGGLPFSFSFSFSTFS
jgi:hypothetical protein